MADPQDAEGRENPDIDCHENDIPTPNLTNFSINEILKPDFGAKKFTVHLSTAFSPIDLRKQPRPSLPSPTPRAPALHPQGKTEDCDSKVWPAWVYCTRYSDRPSSGPRCRKMKKREKVTAEVDDKRPRTAFTNDQLQRLKGEFEDCRYLTEQRRRDLSTSLCLTEAQIKIWFQNKRAKIKKSSGLRNPLALHLMAQGLYNHVNMTVRDGRTEVTS